MKKWTTKKTLPLISGLLLILAVILDRLNAEHLCNGFSSRACSTSFDTYFTLSLLVLPIFLFSLLTYKLPDQVFRAWWRFARWFVPLAVILTLLTPQDRGGSWGIPSLLDPEFVGIVFAFLFAVISIIVIAWKVIVVYCLHKNTRK